MIQRQLVLDGVSDIPSEVTMQAWLRRFGFALVRPATAKPAGWREQRPVPLGPLWQVDVKPKGGSPICVSSRVRTAARVWRRYPRSGSAPRR